MAITAIATRLGVSKSSVSVWVRDVALGDEARAALLRRGPPRRADAPEPAPAGERDCGRCGLTLPLTAFNRSGAGRQHWCRDCFRAYFRARGDVNRRQTEDARRIRRQIAQRLVAGVMINAGCADCGTRDLLVLEFDHVRGVKMAEMARLVRDGAAPNRVRDEVEKCDVVCASCHRIRTARRQGRYRHAGVDSDGWRRMGRAQRLAASTVMERLLASGCVDCGEPRPACLELDDVAGKVAPVAVLLAVGAPVTVVRAEMSRCEVRCANCHRARTLRTKGSWRTPA